MTQINPNLNNQYNAQQQKVAQNSSPQQNQIRNLPQLQRVNPVRVPEFYQVPVEDKKSFKEHLESNMALSMIYEMVLKSYMEHPLATVGTGLGLGVIIDSFSKACSGNYDDSLVKKAANFGDNIQNSKMIQNKPVQAILGGFNSAGKVGGKVIQNSAILRAMKETPTMPEWEMVKTQMFGQKQEVVLDFLRITDALKLGSGEPTKLADVGLNKAEKEMLRNTFNVKKISQIPEEKAVNQVLLSRLSRSPEEIKQIQALGKDASIQATKNEILKEMGLTKEKLKLIKEDVFGKYIDDVMVATGKVTDKVRMGGGHYKWMGPFTKIFERTVGCGEVHNKLKSMSPSGAKTATGRFTAKATQMLHRGFTWGNGKLGAMFFIAPILVDLGVNVAKADKDQKVGTAVGGAVQNMSWIFTFPLALRILHAFGGIKYAGMGKEKVEKSRKLINDFNNNVVDMIEKNGQKIPNPNMFKSKVDYDNARILLEKELKNLRKVEGQNIFTRAVRKLAGWITPDLGLIKPYQGSNIASNVGRKIPTFLKNCAGVPLRFILWGVISMGVLEAALSKGSAAIFGKSYDAMKQDERKTERKEQKKFLREDLNKRLYEAQKAKQSVKVQSGVVSQINPANNQYIATRGVNENSNLSPKIVEHKNSMVYEAPKNLTEENKSQIKEEKVDNYTYIPSSKNTIPHPIKNKGVDNYTYIPSSKCTIQPNNKQKEQQRKYIPSQLGAKFDKTFDNSGLQGALNRAQMAENKALKVLAGNFEGMS